MKGFLPKQPESSRGLVEADTTGHEQGQVGRRLVISKAAAQSFARENESRVPCMPLCVRQMNRWQMTRAALIHIAYPRRRVLASRGASTTFELDAGLRKPTQGNHKIADRCLQSTKSAPPVDRLENA